MRIQDLVIGYENQPVLSVPVVLTDPVSGIVPFSCMGLDAQFVVKRNATDDDGAALAIGSTVGGQLTWTDRVHGILSVAVPSSATARAGQFCYRIDILNGLAATTVVKGLWLVQAS